MSGLCFPCHKCGKLQGHTFLTSGGPPYVVKLNVCLDCYPAEVVE